MFSKLCTAIKLRTWIQGPFTQEVTQLLRLGNPSNDPMAFKVGVPVTVLPLDTLTDTSPRLKPQPLSSKLYKQP